MSKVIKPEDLSIELERALAKVVSFAAGAVDETAHELAADALEVTPLDTEALRLSQYVETSDERLVTTAEIGYNADNSAPYAVEVHELQEPVNWTTDGTTNKFLQRPVLDKANSLAQMLKERIMKRWRR